MLVVHHLNNSRSQRILWLLEELALPYEIKRYARDPATMLAPPALRLVHPLGKSPVVTDEGTTLAESGAIIEYLVERYGGGRLRPAEGTPERARYTYFMHYAEGSAMPPLLLALVFSRLPKAKVPFFVKPILRGVADRARATFIGPQLELHLSFMEGELHKSEWFAGADFSAADIQMSFPVEAFAARGGLNEKYPKLRSYLDRIRARPAYRRAVEAGGPFEIMT